MEIGQVDNLHGWRGPRGPRPAAPDPLRRLCPPRVLATGLCFRNRRTGCENTNRLR